MQKSRPWAAMVAVVVLAALVVLSGCQGAVGPAGRGLAPAGPSLDRLERLVHPGTTDNATPTLKTPIPPVYLALGGTGAKTEIRNCSQCAFHGRRESEPRFRGRAR